MKGASSPAGAHLQGNRAEEVLLLGTLQVAWHGKHHHAPYIPVQQFAGEIVPPPCCEVLCALPVHEVPREGRPLVLLLDDSPGNLQRHVPGLEREAAKTRASVQPG